ncbi:MAG: flagellar protein FlgN [Clostridiaceae bacterium]|nr:flagellar protein FlgN [Clostridiaceae bacterium]
MTSSPEEYIERLSGISQKKYVLLQDLYILTQSQAVAIDCEEIKKLEELIENKQLKIDAITKLDDDFGVYFKRLKQILGVSSLDEVKEASYKGVKEFKTAVKNILDISKEISQMENDNNMKARKLLDSIGEEIRKMNMGRKANSVYNQAADMKQPSYYIDKKK